MILALGEEVRSALRQLYKRAALVKFQPAQADRVLEARRVFRRRPFVTKQERAVDLLNVDYSWRGREAAPNAQHRTSRISWLRRRWLRN
jgi:hypothetical protein